MLYPIVRETALRGKKVLVRSSLDAPIEHGIVTDDYRLEQSARTLKFLQEQGAQVYCIGHLGRKGESLAPVSAQLQKYVQHTFLDSFVKPIVANGEIVMLKNVRSDLREEKGNTLFAQELASGMDLFVYDDLAAAHRSHSSITHIQKILPTYTGVRFQEEVDALLKITTAMQRPSVAFLGGAKIETKLPILKKLLNEYDTVCVGGITANIILKQRGYEIGTSVYEDFLIEESVLNHKKLLVPDFVRVSRSGVILEIESHQVRKDDRIVDIGENAIITWFPMFEKCKTILWNGPLGYYEGEGTKASIMLSTLVKKSSAFSVVGGGDTAALLRATTHDSDWSFVSTGGGALLEYLTTGTLVAIDACQR